MRSELEKQLAILTLEKEKEVVMPVTFFGDSNIKSIEYSIRAINGEWTEEDEIWELEESGELTNGERENVEQWFYWVNCQGEEIVDLLWNEESLVTELPTEEESNVVSQKHCAKTCKECPFSNKSMSGWLSDYTGQDILNFKNAEASFPCHMQMPDKDMSVEETQKAIDNGEMKLCRGYVEFIIKSAKRISRNEQLAKAIEEVKAEGLSEHTMDMFEFFKHHKLEF